MIFVIFYFIGGGKAMFSLAKTTPVFCLSMLETASKNGSRISFHTKETKGFAEGTSNQSVEQKIKRESQKALFLCGAPAAGHAPLLIFC
jgi:hypothetical protein